MVYPWRQYGHDSGTVQEGHCAGYCFRDSCRARVLVGEHCTCSGDTVVGTP